MARYAAVVALAATVLAGCDGGESGPGAWSGGLEADVLVSGAVLEVHGEGIDDIEGIGTTRAIHAPVGTPEQARHRVVLVASGQDPIRFRIRVQDVAHGEPGVALLSAVDVSNQPVANPGSVTVTLFR